MYDLGEKARGVIFQKVDFKRWNAAVQRVNQVLRFFETSNIAEINNRIVASSAWVSRQLGLKKGYRDGKTKSEPNRNINLLTTHRK